MFGFAILKKGCVVGGQYSRNRGRVRQKGRDPGKMPLATESLKIWRALERNHGNETGFRRIGITYPCRTAGEKVKVDKWTGTGETFGLLSPSDSRAEPSLAVPVPASKAGKLGAVLPEVCILRGFKTASGTVSDTDSGFGNIGTMTSWLRLEPGRARSRGLSVCEFRSCGYVQRWCEWTGWKTHRKCPSAVVASRFAGGPTADTRLPSEIPTSHFSFRPA